MKILGDSQILLFDELFSSLGETSRYTGRHISAEQLEGVDALITRSTVKVDPALLKNSSVKFVGTCTIGTDHLDTGFLDQQSIAWANAPGCNANAVAQYVLSAMALLAPRWQSAIVGIIACGNIGRQVYRRLRALGVHCRVYDPFLSVDQQADLVTLDEVLQADIITAHAPLTTTGPYPTKHLLGEAQLQQLRPNTLLINAGRGAVVDNQALYRLLSSNKTIRVALDVWEDEPDILAELLPLVDIATPHIAGHSLEGKENGTVSIYHALCQFLQQTPVIDTQQVVNRERSELIVDAAAGNATDYFNQCLLAAYPILDDDQRLRAWQNAPTKTLSIGQHFDEVRKRYQVRREYSHFILPKLDDSALSHWFKALVD